ncbi:MAG: hypothetical protein ABGW91_10810 [Christiangramia sp.]
MKFNKFSKPVRHFSLLGFFLCICQLGNAQLSTSFYTNNHLSKVGVGYEFNEKLWSEVRFYSGTNIHGITPEVVLNYNFRRKEYYDAYIGGGLVVNYFDGIVIQAGVLIKPIQELPNLSLIIELQPLYEGGYNQMFLNGFGGLRFRF